MRYERWMKELLTFLLGLDIASLVYTYSFGQEYPEQLMTFLGSGMFGLYAQPGFWFKVQTILFFVIGAVYVWVNYQLEGRDMFSEG